MHILFLNNLSAHRPAPVPWPNIPRASFRGCWRGLRTPPPRRLQNYIFRTTPKAENGQSTVKCRDYFIFQAPKCTRATFSRSLAPDPMHRASLQHSPRPAIAGGDGACSPEAYVVPGLSLSVLRLPLFGLVSHSRTWPRPANH